MTNQIQAYLQDVTQIYQKGNATEHTYRPALKRLLESLDNNILAVNEPKRIACGAPDFWIGQGALEIGHLEAKDIGISLKSLEKKNQMQRYFNALGNLILTDHLEFRWYVGGELRLSAAVATFDKQKKIKADADGILEVDQLLRQFLLTKVVQVTTPRALAKRMAALAQLIRDAINTALNDSDRGGMLRQQLESFRLVLIRDLTGEQFADMYAQTICYGLFAARCNTNQVSTFSRETAGFRLPKTNPFLRGIFNQIAGSELDDRITWAVDTLATILQQTDMSAILSDFGKRDRREDPVVHFYETFLAEYDPKMRESRGVYYTPEPVVGYIVRSVDYILKEKFGIKKGLADSTKILPYPPQSPLAKGGGKDSSSPPSQGGVRGGSEPMHKVLILDPAVGTGTFMHRVIEHIYEGFKNQKGMWSGYVSQHLLPRLFGFELLMAPYTVAHMKLGLQLQETGYDFSSEERLRIYLTNTLQEGFQIPAADGFMNRIRDEAEAAKGGKQDTPVMVILGNPPYSYESMNTDPWIVNLVKDYYHVDGKPLGERNPKGLLDDYVKFIRFAQHRVAETGYGVVALITNHGYLDNPTFRGMRQNLMQTFDEIYVLDLHGNSKKKQVCPDGSPDQNVFDIQQGVAIAFFIKYQDSQQDLAKIYHADLWGVREVKENKELVGGKYYWLDENEISSTVWEKLEPAPEFYLFSPQNIDLQSEYFNSYPITQIFTVNSVGISTSRDRITIHFEEKNLINILNQFKDFSIQELKLKLDLDKDTRDWTVELAQKDIKNSGAYSDHIAKVLYRPFDIRHTYYTGRSRGFHSMPRGEVMDHLFQNNNIALCTNRQVNNDFRHIFATENITDGNSVSLETRERTYIFPLYLYPTNTPTLFETEPTNSPHGRRPNLAPEFINELSQKLSLEFFPDGKGDQVKTFAPEDIFNYIYATFHSPTYRQRYAEFLKIDFPRVPITTNKQLFWELATKGDRLVQLHLMKETGTEISSYPIDGSNLVEQVKYNETQQQIWINDQQYFANIPNHIWNFYIGGYQVCQKWLKDRKGRELSFDDLVHYQNIISILGETIEIMSDIDQTITKHGGFPFS
ncbi:adenine specific DNA methyltransferase [Pseudanabaena sp. lw0831]|uniref:type ISP restriction/modification enzyme n=1 Tax=Pseudanabaena sp. lw0831 TaxID=1357935 RepID=UPI001916825D|nr:type ISP restriction/modification enzyme [Pseudanabaena sp. lw0831]GBO56193.1 adenine specific DNA methyltransferase [Pseudanabaena sp. lw0831]